ncbi:MAG: hypothetical protein HN731_19735 [Rhodospirillaceae bacterium]|nr:hypothetical protein [Rhodospirillaceae bacterium]
MADTSTELELGAEDGAEDRPDIGPESTPEPDSEQSPATPGDTEAAVDLEADTGDDALLTPEESENLESAETPDSPEEADVAVDDGDASDDETENAPAEDDIEEPADEAALAEDDVEKSADEAAPVEDELEETAEEAEPAEDELEETAEEAEPAEDAEVIEAEEEPEDDIELEDAAEVTEAQKWEDEAEAAPDTTPPATLENRYDIYPGRPLPDLDSPSARAFEAEDRMQPQLKLFALICIPGLPIRWDELLDIEGIDLPGNLALAAYGNIDWQIQNQKCLALIYERPLGGHVDILLKDPHEPEYKKIDALRLVAETGIRALKSLQERELTHRSIRPDNIFFLDDDHEEVVFGEFISSPPGFDQPVAFETIERGMADEGGRGIGSIAEDIYALGATLAFFLQRQNPVRGKSKEQLLLAKMSTNSYQILVGKTILTATMLEPIRGMLNDDQGERWGFDELDMWLSGRRVAPTQTAPVQKSQRPFRFGDFDHTQPRTLAYSMSDRRESALKLIKDGSIEQWYSRGLENSEMATAVAAAVETADALAETDPNADELLLSRILILMDPKAPITFKNIKYMSDGFGYALGVEVLREGNIKTYAESIVNQVPGIWYEISDGAAASQFSELEFYTRLRGYLQKAGPGYGIERCLYETIPGHACRSPLIAMQNVSVIEEILPTLDAAEKMADTKKSPVDRHLAAFIAARTEGSIESQLGQLGDLDETFQILGMLRLLVELQDRMNTGTLLGLTKWVGGLMGPVIKLYHSRSTRRDIEADVPRIVRSGDLSELLGLLDDPVTRKKDELEYLAALEEFEEAEEEVLGIEENTGPGSEAALRTSNQVAAVTSILIMIFIISLIIMAG